jgi:enamine deaminase RidA (YjgF/YER057c/UK114 family)
MTKTPIHTDRAPAAIGTYSQAVQVDDTVYLSGQIPLDPTTMQMVNASIEDEIHQVADLVKLNVYLTDLAHFARVNELMAQYVPQPYPARAAVGVAALPRGARVEADGVLVLRR